jgi:hypothetical protein
MQPRELALISRSCDLANHKGCSGMMHRPVTKYRKNPQFKKNIHAEMYWGYETHWCHCGCHKDEVLHAN